MYAAIHYLLPRASEGEKKAAAAPEVVAELAADVGCTQHGAVVDKVARGPLAVPTRVLPRLPHV
jgi:hypothetical protein